MKLSAFKEILKSKSEIAFELPNGELVPSHFHVTEVGQVEKFFIDCGGTIRKERRVNFQLWEANDFDHRLHPNKLFDIIDLSQEKLQLTDEEIEVEYQGETIGKYFLDYKGGNFLLVPTLTDCLAPDKCGVPSQKLKVSLSDLSKPKENSCCTPGSGCC
jgi:hypothetical protein